MKKTILALIISGILVLSAGCSDGKSETDGTSGTDGTTAATEQPDPLDELADTDPVYGSRYVYDDYSPYIKAGDLSLIKVSRVRADEMVEEYLDGVLANYQGVDFVDAPDNATVAMRDQVTIFYTGYSADPSVTVSEETLASMTNASSEEGYELVIGSGAFIHAYESKEHPEKNNPGFEEQLIGAKAGEKRTVTVTFPDVYNSAPELQGMPIKFDVEIVKIMNPDPDEPTELTDELVEEYTDGKYASIDALRAFMLDNYKAELALDAARSQLEVISYPEDEYNRLLESYMDYYVTDDTSEEDKAALQESGDKAVKEILDEQLTLNFLFRYYNITLTKAEYLGQLQDYYNENSMTLAYYYGIFSVEDMEDSYTRDEFISYFKSVKLGEHLVEIAQWDESAPGTA